MTTELHPLGFFLPASAKLLMLGSFPPPKVRWSMDFYYPNIQNDMWRILGVLFYADKDHFLAAPKAFSREKAVAFCPVTTIASQRGMRSNTLAKSIGRTTSKN